uniref:Protein ripply1 n=1 Tax=Aquila chrysaetos chrysaetos TaxID=223781 RepID=A0A663FD90_AQUCH
MAAPCPPPLLHHLSPHKPCSLAGAGPGRPPRTATASTAAPRGPERAACSQAWWAFLRGYAPLLPAPRPGPKAVGRRGPSPWLCPCRLLWPKSKSFDYLYGVGEKLLENFPVQATLCLYEDSGSEEEGEEEEEEEPGDMASRPPPQAGSPGRREPWGGSRGQGGPRGGRQARGAGGRELWGRLWGAGAGEVGVGGRGAGKASPGRAAEVGCVGGAGGCVGEAGGDGGGGLERPARLGKFTFGLSERASWGGHPAAGWH